jgi:GT2 family glycosyltransferase
VSDQLEVSVITPTHGRRDSILQMLKALVCQTVPKGTFEVLIVCDGDVDGTGDACRTLGRQLSLDVRVFDQTNQGPSAARNLGVREARAPLIVFLDDDVVPEEGLIAAHLNAQRGQHNLATFGPMLPPPKTRMSLWARYEERMLCRQYDDMMQGRWEATYRQFYTGNASIHRQHILDAGGFDITFHRVEDVELALRLHRKGIRFAFVPRARGRHYVSRSFSAWLRIPTAYGAADVALERAHAAGILDNVNQEFRHRHPAIRVLVALCAGRPLASSMSLAVLSSLIRRADALGPVPGSEVLCSLAFNLAYYHAMAIALGGRAMLQTLLGSNKTPSHVHL